MLNIKEYLKPLCTLIFTIAFSIHLFADQEGTDVINTINAKQSVQGPQKPLLTPNTKNEDRFVQTEAHFQPDYIRSYIEKEYKKKVTPFLHIIADTLAKEMKFKNSHYVFYHGTNSEWMVPQDLYTLLYKASNPTKNVAEEFKFTRFEEQSIFEKQPTENKTAKGYLVSALQNNGLIDDRGAMGAYFLSTNLSLFGNVGSGGECTWEYFLKSKSHHVPSREDYEKMMTKFGLGNKYIDEIMALEQLIKTEGQMLMQIFIPQEKVDQVAYLAWARGIPAHDETIKWILGHIKSKRWEDIEPVLDKLTEQFKTEQEKNPMFKEIIEDAKKGNFSPAAFLKMYRNNPWELEGMNFTQARLLMSPETMLNPTWGVKIHTYTTTKRKTLAQYNQKLNALVAKLMQDKKTQKNNPTVTTPVTAPNPPAPAPIIPKAVTPMTPAPARVAPVTPTVTPNAPVAPAPQQPAKPMTREEMIAKKNALAGN